MIRYGARSRREVGWAMTDAGEVAADPAALRWTSRRPLSRLALAALVALVLMGWRGLMGYDTVARQPEVLEGAERFFFSPADGNPRLIFALTLLLLYQRRRAILLCAGVRVGRDIAIGLPLLLSGGALAVWSVHVGVAELLVPSLSLTLLGGAAIWGGAKGLRTMSLPAAFLLLAWRPPGILINQIIYPMQLLTAQTTGALLAFFGMQAASSGDLIFANDRVFHVIETCAGLRSVFTLVMASVVYVEVMGCPRLRGLIIVAISPLVAFLVNELRVVMMVLNPLSQFATIHTLQGVMMIVFGVLLLAGIDRLLAATPLAGSRAFDRGPTWPDGWPPSGRTRYALLATGLLATVMASVLVPVWPDSSERAEPLHRLPHELEGWQSTPLKREKEVLGSAQTSEWLHRGYVKGGRRVTLLMAIDLRLDPRSSMLSEKQLLPGAGWRIVGRSEMRLPGERVGEEILLASPRGETEIAWWWTSDVDTPRIELGRALLALDRSGARRANSARLIQVRTAVDPAEPESARAALHALLGLVLEDFETRGENQW